MVYALKSVYEVYLPYFEMAYYCIQAAMKGSIGFFLERNESCSMCVKCNLFLRGKKQFESIF
jgi:hypothetical protein